jgi:tetratricopeptide (TPR) repeat protein
MLCALFPRQDYPLNQIKKIDQILEDRRSEQKKTTLLDAIDFSNLQNVTFEQRAAAYKEAMALGESFMKNEEWGIARFYFRRALALMPNDQAATLKIDEAEARIRGSNANAEKYTEMIQRADEAFATGDFSVARFYYIKAKEAKPDDDYVNERIRVSTQLVESTTARVANREYDDSMKRANEALAASNYSVARFFFRKALSHKPDDPVAKQKLDEVEKLIKQ